MFSRYSEGVRQFLCVPPQFPTEREAHRQPLEDDGGDSAANGTFGCDQQGYETSRVQILRLDNLLRPSSGNRAGQRSPSRLSGTTGFGRGFTV